MRYRTRSADQYDSIYTRMPDIENELKYYSGHFRNKTVLCNCDDPYESGFCQYFIRNFNRLELKKLISTAHSSSSLKNRILNLPQYAVKNHYSGYSLEISQVPVNSENATDQELLPAIIHCSNNQLQLHNADGDFQSYDSMRRLAAADIVVTHPPASLLLPYLEQIFLFRKKFLIIVNMDFLTGSAAQTMLKNQLFWYGVNSSCNDWNFICYPPRATPGNAVTVNLNCCRWITNLTHTHKDADNLLGF